MLWFIIGVLIPIVLGVMVYRIKSTSPAKVITPKVTLSEPAALLRKKYLSIPDEHRPFPSIDSMLAAMDEGLLAQDNDMEDIAHHFAFSSYNGYGPTDIDRTCSYPTRCDFKTYHALNKSFDEIKKSVASKEQAIIEARIKPDLDQVQELMARLKDEATLNYKFANEFKELA